MALAEASDLRDLHQNIGPELLSRYCGLLFVNESQNSDTLFDDQIYVISEYRDQLIRYGWGTKSVQRDSSIRDSVVRKYGEEFLQHVFNLVNHPILGSEENQQYVNNLITEKDKKQSYLASLEIVQNVQELLKLILESCEKQSFYILRNLRYGPWPRHLLFNESWLQEIFSNEINEQNFDEQYLADVSQSGHSDDLIRRLNELWDEAEEITPKLIILGNYNHSQHKTIGLIFAKIIQLQEGNFLSDLTKSVIIRTHEYAKGLPEHVFGRRISRGPKDIFARPGEHGGGRYGGQYYDDDW